MKQSDVRKMLLINTIALMLISSILILLGLGLMHLNSQKNNLYAQGNNHYVSCITSKYGIEGPQDLRTDREHSLYQTILWLNDQCATMMKLGYMDGRVFMASGILLISITLFNGMIWWKSRACNS